jgi:hypothetical protein
MYIGALGGSIPFIIGFLFILLCFLPDPPPIFGFTIGSHPLSSAVIGLPV